MIMIILTIVKQQSMIQSPSTRSLLDRADATEDRRPDTVALITRRRRDDDYTARRVNARGVPTGAALWSRRNVQ